MRYVCFVKHKAVLTIQLGYFVLDPEAHYKYKREFVECGLQIVRPGALTK